ncbi:peptide ABC transporter substrate-binding protein [Elongatibacter sediminis]|uniref:Peptide ABC transporter substrate-binding protein n=1 Tax=Elongatibacter sediminis TaxID=3119006 RepID=A0AAW9RDU6_9GAMM
MDRRGRHRWPATVCAILLPVMLAGCGGGSDAPAQTRERRPVPVELVEIDGRPDSSVLAAEQVIYRGNGEEPQTLDPHLAEGVPASNILRDLFEGLTTESPGGDIVPGAAMRWNISRDGRTYTFYLRRGATWSNGDPLTAADFVYSLRRAADPRTAANNAAMLSPILNAPDVIRGRMAPDQLGVTALDEYSLQITLADPTPYFLGLLAHSIAYPVHRPSVEDHGDRFSRAGNLVSNGAFTLNRWDVRSAIELERNPNYRAFDEVVLERVLYLPIEDLSSEVKQFRAGELDWTYEVPHNQFDWLRRHYADELVISPWLGSYFFGFNLSREPFIENPDLRRALVLAVDRDIITDKVTRFGEEPSYVLVPPGIDDYDPAVPEYAAWTQAERDAEAKRLYQQAGYSAERPLEVELRYNTSENHKKIALAIASMWKQTLGVRTTLINEEWKVFLQNREQKVLTQIFRAGWISDYNDPYSFLELFRTGHGQNDYAYSNESFDALLEEVARERVPARRNRMMHEAERLLLEDSPIIPVYTYVTKRLVDRHVRGWQNNVMDHHYSRSMFKLKSRDGRRSAVAEPAPVTPQTEPAAAGNPADARNGAAGEDPAGERPQ